MNIPVPLLQLLRQVKLLVLDFDGVLTDNRVWVNECGQEMVACWRGDGLGIKAVEKLGIKVFIFSTEENPVVSARAAKLKVKVHQNCDDKLESLTLVIGELGISLAAVSYVGNDVNDLDCLKSVGLPIVVHDAHQDVIDVALYRTRALGGRGAVREVCDMIVAANKHNMKDL